MTQWGDDYIANTASVSNVTGTFSRIGTSLKHTGNSVEDTPTGDDIPIQKVLEISHSPHDQSKLGC